MSDPNYNPQPYPSQNQPQNQPPQYGQQQSYEQSQYTQPQSNPYTASQQYAQTPQYGQPQYQQPQYVQSQYGQQSYMGQQPADTGSFGWAVLGFFFPIVGLILFLVWKSEKPVSAKQAGMGALASVISTVVLWILLIVFAAMIGSAVTY
ncbi:hypothetical protein [Bifidobacterium catenulatum]|uniref:Uncharacterized protein n=1 Tax=Bifidobacterium catenulatum subsp. kashiwanohense TaxID=630129 RepID=A0AA43P4N9_9BIFI|nr:hypothetical protein [Bifidobacterium catenulatum]MDH7889032.1 hypothetical protein [Bifidobacterium catenulatum subsp. kashiwanohense]